MAKTTGLLLCVVGCISLVANAAAIAQDPAASTAEPKQPRVAATARFQLPPGQVFECLNNGQRIFSDAPCGAHASIRQLNDLNVMDRPAAIPNTGYRSHGPAFQPNVTEPAPYGDESVPEVASDAYATQVIVVRERTRRDHFPRHDYRPHRRAHKN